MINENNLWNLESGQSTMEIPDDWKSGIEKMTDTNPIKIAAAMIVRDEERNLAQCLTSIIGIMDEVILLDTGSQDATIDIAKRFGCKVHETTWKNSFAVARNEVFDLVPDYIDWILVIDADERFGEVNKDTFRKSFQHINPNIHALACTVINQSREGKVSSIAQGMRFFRNNQGIHYENDVHNRAIVPYGTAAPTDIKIYHYGYDLSPQELEQKTNRILSMLWKRAQEKPTDPATHYYLANTFMTINKFIKAIYHGEISMDLYHEQINKKHGGVLPVTGSDCPDFIKGLYFVIARSYVEIGAINYARAWIDHGLAEIPDDIDLNYLAAMLAYNDKDFPKCNRCANKYIESLKRYQERPDLIGGRNILLTDKIFEEQANVWIKESQPTA